MGECGCGNFGSNLIIKIDEDRYINIEFYAGCESCDNPAGILVQPFDKKGAEDWLLDCPWHKIVELEFDQYADKQQFIELFEHQDIIKAAKEIIAEEGIKIREYSNALSIIRDMPRLTRYATINAYKRQKSAKKKS